MRRKFLSVVLCVCMMLTMAPFAFATGSDDTSTTNTQEQAPVANSSSSGSGGSTTSVSLPKDNTGNLTISTDNAVLDGSAEGTANLTYTNGKISVTGNNVTIKNLTFGDGASLEVNADTFTLTGCIFNGSTYIRNPVSLNVSNATVTGNTFSATESDGTPAYYNAIEFSLNSGHKLNSATLSNNTFTAAIENNYFSAYYFENNAKITVENNVIQSANKGSSAIRISNSAYATGVEFTLNNNSYEYGNSADSDYEGFILLQDFAAEGADSQNFTSFKINISNLNTPDSAKRLLYVFKDRVGIISYNQPAVTGDSSIEKFAIAKVDNSYSPSLASAVAAATSGQTITLLKDTALTSSISIEKNVTLDLGGKTLSRKGGMLLDIYGNVTIQNGTIAMTDTTRSGADIWVNQTAKLTVEKSATISAPINSFAIAYYQDCTAAEVTLKGTLTGEGSGITVNGNIKDKDSSNQNTSNKLILDGTTINVKGHGIYQAGYATTTFTENASTITGSTGIEVRAGNLTVTNSTITGNGTFQCKAKDNGTTTDGVGIAIAQHTTKLPINVTISGGTISGKYAVYESNPQNNDSIDQVNLSITGGNFNGSTAAVYSQDVKNFISGGLFTTDPSDYCVANKAGIPSNNRNYPFTIGSVEQNVEVAPATPNAVAKTEGITDTNVTTAMNASAEAAKGTTATGLDAIGGKEATNVTSSEVNTAKEQLSKTSGVTINKGDSVTLYVQPYLDITVTGAKVNEQQKATELSLSITPMVKKVASTAKKADDIALTNETGKTKNATVISDTEVKNVNTPVTIKLALPNDFAQDKAKLSIKHTKANGSIEYYTGTVSTEGEKGSAKTYVTFTTNGFSPFVIYAASANVASIGEGENQKVYPTLQAAIDAVQNNETITLLKDTNENVTVSKPIKFTLAGKDQLKGSIAAGSRYSMTTSDTTSGNTEYTFTYVGGGSSSSISTPTTYAVNVNAATNGAVAADKKTASKGTTVTVTASPSKGYVVDAVKVVDKDGKDVAVTEKDGKYVFTMPASAVTVTGSFKAETPAPVALPFTDVKSDNWFYDAVKYAYAQGLMTGTSATTFAPNETMNRAMIVTVLYRLEKSPAVTGASKFTDVPAGQWYSDAVAWAAANKIVNGYDETTFGPMNAVTREQMAAILFRYEQVKGLENVTLEENLNRFPDQNKISAYAIPALQWAVGQKIINGNADGTLDPTGTATRAQVAQIFTNLLNQ